MVSLGGGVLSSKAKENSDFAQRLTPQKSRFPSWPQGELAICSSSARWVSAQELKVTGSDDANQYGHQVTSATEWKLILIR